MSEITYYPVAHVLARTLQDVCFPLSRRELLDTWGATVVAVAPGEITTVALLIEKTTLDRFDTAASLHNALMAALRSA